MTAYIILFVVVPALLGTIHSFATRPIKDTSTQCP